MNLKYIEGDEEFVTSESENQENDLESCEYSCSQLDHHSSQGSTTSQHPSVSLVAHLPSKQCFALSDKPLHLNHLINTSQNISVVLQNDVHGSELCILENNATLSSNMLTQIFSAVSRYLLSTDYSLCCTRIVGGMQLSVSKVTKSNMHQNLPPSLLSNYNAPWNSYPSLASDSNLVTPEYDLPMIHGKISYNSHTPTNCLDPKMYLACFENTPYANKGEHPLFPVNNNAGISFSNNVVNLLSSLKIKNHYDMMVRKPPQRFLSMKKERLCLSMSFRGMYDDNNDYKYESKLFFGNQTEHDTLSATSETAGGESYMTDESSEKVSRKKAILCPNKIIKKLKRNKKGSPPKTSSSHKGHTEGLIKKGSPPKAHLQRPHVSHLLPALSTKRTSVNTRSEGVVAFSQLQMQDMESIALKLMTELKSMKNIVERKFLNEAYRCRSMKNDADQVKLAIKNAERVEKTTKKRLSMMSRDCNRFCKIMSQPQRLTEDIASATETIMRKKKRKISFADEAGGVLCHVKYFENLKNNAGVTS